MKSAATFALIIVILLPIELPAQKGGSHSRSSVSHSSSRSSSSPKSSSSKSNRTRSKSTVAVRNGNGRIKRSASAKREFMKQTGYSHGRKGYVVDHIVPLECGGADSPSNMQWQTAQEAKIKDRTERNCRRE